MPILANVIQDAFSPLISAFEWVLVFIHNHILGGGSWGLSIVGLTVLVRAVMVPLTLKQFRSMRKMQVLQPHLKELQAKHKDDKQRQSEEMMKLYREHGVNPFASCLPLLLQLPILVSLFYMLRTDLKVDICGPQLERYFHVHTKSALTSSKISPKLTKIGCSQVPGGHHLAKFLFIPDITLKASGVVLVVLILLYIVTQLGSSLLMSTAVDRSQRIMMLGLPLIFVIFFIQYPAGLLVYWITTNTWTIGQQYFVRQRMGATPPPPPQESGGGFGRGRGGGSGRGPGGNGGSPEDGRGGSSRSTREREPALVTSANAAGSGPPPRSPRKKKKRSGRRR